MADTTNTLSPYPQKMYDRKLLMRALPNLCLTMFGQQRNLERNSGNQVSYRRFNALATVTTPLTEGITPGATNLSRTEVTVTAAQYGNYVTVSDALNLLDVDRVVYEASEVLGENGGQSVEEIIRAEILNGTNVVFPVGRTTRGSIQAGDVITTERVRRAVRVLEGQNASVIQGNRADNGMGGSFMGYIHPNVFSDLLGDSEIKNTVQYSSPEIQFNYSLPELCSVLWYKSTKAPVFAGAGTGGVDVYCTFIFGKESFGILNIGGSQGGVNASGKLTTFVKDAKSGGTSDPLEQRSTIGWKSWQAPKLLNNAFLVRIESTIAA